MRKDAKIGFAIGGILLAVLVVYVLVVPSRAKKAAPNGVSLVHPETGSAVAGGSSQGGGSTAVTDTTGSAPAPTNNTAAGTDTHAAGVSDTGAPSAGPAVANAVPPAGADNTDWGRLLGAGPMLSATPPGTGAEASSNNIGSNSAHGIAASANNDARGSALNGGVNTPGGSSGNTAASASTVGTTTTAASNAITAIPAGTREYTVKSGETLSSIAAARYGNSRFYVAILRANPSLNPNRMKPGIKIILPDVTEVRPEAVASTHGNIADTTTVETVSNGKTYKVAAGDNLYRISVKLFGSPKMSDTIYQLNKEAIGPDRARLHLGMVLKLPEVTATASR